MQTGSQMNANTHSQALVIFINQLRMKIGVMFGNPETTTGVRRFQLSCSVRGTVP